MTRTSDDAPNAADAPPIVPMPTWRKALAMIVVAVIVLGLYEGVTGRAHWPFHAFRMFSMLSPDAKMSLTRIYVVDAQGRDLALSDPAYSEPILIYHVRLAFARASDLKHGRCETLARMSREYLARYERYRKLGRHAGPELTGLRLYEVTWDTLDPGAANVGHPDHRVLLYDSAQACDDRVEAPSRDAAAAAASRAAASTASPEAHP